MNQILDHTGPKKPKMRKNPEDTIKIIKVYAILIMTFGFFFIAKGAYSLVGNSELKKMQANLEEFDGPRIELYADQDELSIDVSYTSTIESISYQWYRGIVTSDEINEYEATRERNSNSDDVDNDDEIQEETDEIIALGDLQEIKLENGENQKEIKKIGIPRGDTTIRVIVKVDENNISEYIQSYHTDIGIDKIPPTINVKLQGTKLIVVATDETEISKLVYSLNGTDTKEISDRYDKKTIKAEIQLDEVGTNGVKINAVDKANNTGTYTQDIELFVGKPEITFGAEPDFSKIYVYVSYSKGITKVEYEFNGESFSNDFDDPKENTNIEIQLDAQEGHNIVKVKVYTEEEQVYAEDYGECDYNP